MEECFPSCLVLWRWIQTKTTGRREGFTERLGVPGSGASAEQAVSACGVSSVCPPLQPFRLQPSRLLCPWDPLGKNTGVGCHFFLQGLPNPGIELTVIMSGPGTTDWFLIGKGVCQGCILQSCLFNLYTEYNMRIAGLGEAQAGIKIARRNINNLRYAD